MWKFIRQLFTRRPVPYRIRYAERIERAARIAKR